MLNIALYIARLDPLGIPYNAVRTPERASPLFCDLHEHFQGEADSDQLIIAAPAHLLYHPPHLILIEHRTRALALGHLLQSLADLANVDRALEVQRMRL